MSSRGFRVPGWYTMPQVGAAFCYGSFIRMIKTDWYVHVAPWSWTRWTGRSFQCGFTSNPFFAVARKLKIGLRRGRQTVTMQLQVVVCAEDTECARKHLRSFASGQHACIAYGAERLFPANWQSVESPGRCSHSVWRYRWQTQFILKFVTYAESSVESRKAGPLANTILVV